MAAPAPASLQAAPLSRLAVLGLAWPIVFAQASSALVGVVDTAVMGRTGDAADLAAVAVGATLYGFVYWGAGFLRMSATALTAQAAGAGRPSEVRAVLSRGVMLGAVLGMAALLLSPLILGPAFLLFEAEPATEALAAEYAEARFLGAPAYLAGLAVTGSLIGQGRTRALLAFQLVMNLCNAGITIWLVSGLDMGPRGVGLGSAAAEWIALAFGILLVRRQLGGLLRPALLASREGLAALFSANRDIFIRTLALIVSFTWFVRSGTLISTEATAANEVLLMFITVTAFVLDSFAYIAEKEAGEAAGARSLSRLKRSMRLTSELAVAFAILASLLLWAAGPSILRFVIADAGALEVALLYLPWCAAVPVMGVAAYQLDGLFLGATYGKALRRAGIAASVLYVAADITLRPLYGNTGVWAAFLLMYVFRAAGLALFLPALWQRLERQSPRPAASATDA